VKTTFKISFSIPEIEKRLSSFLSDHDSANISAYAEVTKHQELARVNIIREGEEGSEKEETHIPHFFNTNNLVSQIEKDSDTVIYLAKESGFARFSPEEIRVTEDAIISEDIGPITGDIKVKSDLIIRGHVLNGFSVECGGNLNIIKSIEDNVKITCAGDLEVGWGISGKKTEISCQQNAKVSFVEKSTVYCAGDLEVKGTLLQAEIYCGKLNVLGSGMTSKSRGAVVGGMINGLYGVTLKSVGSQSCKTEIISGVDLRIQKELKEAEDLFGVLKKKILAFQKGVETYLAAVGGNDPAKMNQQVKELVRNKLFKLKNQQNVLSELNSKIRSLKSKQFPKESLKSRITILEFIDPIVKIKFNEAELVIKERAPGRRAFKLLNGLVTVVQ
jgi:uncharacterized protein